MRAEQEDLGGRPWVDRGRGFLVQRDGPVPDERRDPAGRRSHPRV